jgi:hypothetical protein
MKTFDQLLDDFETAAIVNAEKGGGPPEEFEIKEQEYLEARDNIKDHNIILCRYIVILKRSEKKANADLYKCKKALEAFLE